MKPMISVYGCQNAEFFFPVQCPVHKNGVKLFAGVAVK